MSFCTLFRHRTAWCQQWRIWPYKQDIEASLSQSMEHLLSHHSVQLPDSRWVEIRDQLFHKVCQLQWRWWLQVQDKTIGPHQWRKLDTINLRELEHQSYESIGAWSPAKAPIMDQVIYPGLRHYQESRRNERWFMSQHSHDYISFN